MQQALSAGLEAAVNTAVAAGTRKKSLEPSLCRKGEWIQYCGDFQFCSLHFFFLKLTLIHRHQAITPETQSLKTCKCHLNEVNPNSEPHFSPVWWENPSLSFIELLLKDPPGSNSLMLSSGKWGKNPNCPLSGHSVVLNQGIPWWQMALRRGQKSWLRQGTQPPWTNPKAFLWDLTVTLGPAESELGLLASLLFPLRIFACLPSKILFLTSIPMPPSSLARNLVFLLGMRIKKNGELGK